MLLALPDNLPYCPLSCALLAAFFAACCFAFGELRTKGEVCDSKQGVLIVGEFVWL